MKERKIKKNVFMLGGFILLASSVLAKEALVVPEQKPEILVMEKPVEVMYIETES
uniref:hypothetical protein n=1 Tax=Fusobacterium necrophorum TaxID=859 RepID=UPI0036F3C53F